MLVLAIRTLILFVLVVAATRIMGKREIGQLQPFEFVIAIMIADLASVPVSDTSIPLAHGVIPILVLLAMHLLTSLISLKSPRMRVLISGRPVTIIREGRLLANQMRQTRYNFNDLMEELRANGVLSVADVEYAVLETNGRLSVIPKSGRRPLQADDLGLFLPRDPMTHILVCDGQTHSRNLDESGYDRHWLAQKLAEHGYDDARKVFFASVDDAGRFYIQGYDGGRS